MVVRPTYRMAYILIHHINTQAAYTISKDVCHSLTSLIGTTRRDRVGSPPQTASPSLPFWTDIMEMKDALGGWSAGGPMHTQRSTPARWVAAPVPAHQCRQPPQPFPNDADHRASRPPPPRYTGLIARHRSWTIACNCPIAQVRYIIHQRRCALRRPFPANPLSQAVPPT